MYHRWFSFSIWLNNSVSFKINPFIKPLNDGGLMQDLIWSIQSQYSTFIHSLSSAVMCRCTFNFLHVQCSLLQFSYLLLVKGSRIDSDSKRIRFTDYQTDHSFILLCCLVRSMNRPWIWFFYFLSLYRRYTHGKLLFVLCAVVQRNVKHQFTVCTHVKALRLLCAAVFYRSKFNRNDKKIHLAFCTTNLLEFLYFLIQFLV